MSESLSVMVPTASKSRLVGRTELLDRIRARVLNGSDVALQSGLPGVGKTALATAVIHDPAIREALPGGRLWLSVGDPERSGLTHWSNRLVTWATRLGARNEDLSPAQRAAEDGDVTPLCDLVHDLLGDRQALLVFDDVWRLEDTLMLSGIGSDCRRVLTTRLPEVAIAFAPAPIKVEELAPEGAIELLGQYAHDAQAVVAGREGDVVTALGGLPLAVVLAGTNIQRLVSVEGQEAARSYIDRLMKAQDRLDDLELKWMPAAQVGAIGATHRSLLALIELTTEFLSPDQAAALRALAAFPPKANTFSRVAGDYVAQGKGLVTELLQTGLLESDALRDRIAMHQAISDYARRGAGGDDDAYRRMAEYLIGFIEGVTAGPAVEEWLRGLELEAENIRAAVLWTVDHEDADLGLRLTGALWPFWYKRNQFQRGLSLARPVLAISGPENPSLAHRLLRAKILNDAGNLAYNMAHLAAAKQDHDQALAIRAELHAEGLVAGSWNNLGLVYRERGELDAAEELFERAREVNQSEAGRQDWLGINLNNLGLVAERRDEFEKAARLQEQSRDVFTACGESWGSAMASVDLGTALLGLGRIDDAVELLRRTLVERLAAADDKRVAAALRGLAFADLQRDRPAAAHRKFLAALALSAPLLDRLGESLTLAGLVGTSARLGDVVTGARAIGALRAYREVTHAVLPGWAEAWADETVLTVGHGEQFARDVETAYRTAVGTGGVDALRLELPLQDRIRAVDTRSMIEEAAGAPPAS